MRYLTKEQIRKLGTVEIIEYRNSIVDTWDMKTRVSKRKREILQECSKVLNSRKKSTDAVDILRQCIFAALDKYDVIGLLEMGCPKDEYEYEANTILVRMVRKGLQDTKSIKAVAEIVAFALTEAFCVGYTMDGKVIKQGEGYSPRNKTIRLIAKEICRE